MFIILLIGQVIFGGYFIYNAYNHFKNHVGMTGYAMSKGIPKPKWAVIGSGILLALGGLLVLFGIKPIIGMCILIAFIVPVSFKMHAFWKETDPMARMMEKIQFTKNMAILGALLMMIGILS